MKKSMKKNRLIGDKGATLLESRGKSLLVLGVCLLVLGFTLSLYSVPVGTDTVLRFPFLDLSFPLVPLLFVFSPVLVSAGWVGWRGSLTALLGVSLCLFTVSLLFVRGIYYGDFAMNIGGMTFRVRPFWPLVVGPFMIAVLLPLLGVFFKWVNQHGTLMKKSSR